MVQAEGIKSLQNRAYWHSQVMFGWLKPHSKPAQKDRHENSAPAAAGEVKSGRVSTNSGPHGPGLQGALLKPLFSNSPLSRVDIAPAPVVTASESGSDCTARTKDSSYFTFGENEERKHRQRETPPTPPPQDAAKFHRIAQSSPATAETWVNHPIDETGNIIQVAKDERNGCQHCAAPPPRSAIVAQLDLTDEDRVALVTLSTFLTSKVIFI
jgi:hypothetical protein